MSATGRHGEAAQHYRAYVAWMREIDVEPSNTTLAELADIYVLNRGNNSISRMKVDGTVIATRTVSLPGSESLGSAKVNGIATSMDGDTIYVTVTGTLPGRAEEGALLELPSFTAQAGDR